MFMDFLHKIYNGLARLSLHFIRKIAGMPSGPGEELFFSSLGGENKWLGGFRVECGGGAAGSQS